MYDLVQQARELMHRDDEPFMPGFGLLIEKSFLRELTSALESALIENEQLKSQTQKLKAETI